MVGRATVRRIGPVTMLLVGCMLAFMVGWLVPPGATGLTPGPAQAQTAGRVTVERATAAGLEAGRLLVGEEEVATLVTPAAGFTGYERALIVADRINRRLERGIAPEHFTVAERAGQTVIEAGPGDSVLTVTPDDARFEETTQAALARRWTSALRQSLGGSALTEAPATGTTDSSETRGEWNPAERYDDKYVPIVSLLEGVRLGVARVNGPRSRVGLTQAVAQFSIDFGSFLEIDIYVPISTREPGRSLSRIQGVGVTGLGDIRL